jgi:hypothetical protein
MNLQEISKRIHRAASHLWQLKKCLDRIPPYCFRFKRVDVPMRVVMLKNELVDLKARRREIKAMQWYPRRSTANKVKTRIMRECIRHGYNAKEIAGYFGISVQNVYKRVEIKTLKLNQKQG